MADWTVFALASALFAGVTAVLAKIGVEAIPVPLATLIRSAAILALMAAVTAATRSWPGAANLNRRSVVFLVLSGLTAGLSWLCYYRALKTGPVSVIAPFEKLSLVIAVFLAVVFLGERLSAWQWLGAGLMAAGAILLVLR